MAGTFIGEPWRLPYSAEQLQAAAEHQIPIIGENGNWWTWNIETQAFMDTGTPAAATGTVNSVNGITPVNGNVTLNARNIGAVSESDTAPVEAAATASRAYAAGDMLIYSGQLYSVTAAISEGDTITPGGNVAETTVAAELAAVNSAVGRKLDKPTNEGATGQVPTLQPDGSTRWVEPQGGGLLPQIIVTTRAGASVTATLGDTTIGPVTADGDGIATLEVPSYGDWTVTAALDGKRKNTVLTVDTVQMYELALSPGNVPLSHTELEYIELTGTQYIDTGLTGEVYDIEAEIYLGDAVQENVLTGAAEIAVMTDYHRQYCLDFDMRSNKRCVYCYSCPDIAGSNAGAVTVNTDYIISAKMTASSITLKLNDIDIPLSTIASGPAAPQLDIYLGASNVRNYSSGVSSINGKFNGRIKHVMLMRANGEIAADFYPDKNENAVVGLYDAARDQFFPSLGDPFIAGPEV